MGAELRWLSGWWNYGEDMAVWQCVDEEFAGWFFFGVFEQMVRLKGLFVVENC